MPSITATSSPISIARRSPSTASSSPAWSPTEELYLPGPMQPSRSASFSSSCSSSPISSSSSSINPSSRGCTFTAWNAYGSRPRSNSASSYISDEELAIEDCSSSDDDFMPAGLQRHQQQQQLQRNKRLASKPAALCTDADEVEVLQRILAAGFTIAEPAEDEPQPRVAARKSEKPRSPRGSTRRTRSGNRSLKRNTAMSTILEVGE